MRTISPSLGITRSRLDRRVPAAASGVRNSRAAGKIKKKEQPFTSPLDPLLSRSRTLPAGALGRTAHACVDTPITLCANSSFENQIRPGWKIKLRRPENPAKKATVQSCHALTWLPFLHTHENLFATCINPSFCFYRGWQFVGRSAAPGRHASELSGKSWPAIASVCLSTSSWHHPLGSIGEFRPPQLMPSKNPS